MKLRIPAARKVTASVAIKNTWAAPVCPILPRRRSPTFPNPNSWRAFDAKDLTPEPGAATQAIFDQGHEVGALAKQMFLDGVEIGGGIYDYDETPRLTQKALKLRKPCSRRRSPPTADSAGWTFSNQRRETLGTLSRSNPRPA